MKRTTAIRAALAFACLGCAGPWATASASDHLDTPSVIGDPRADIGDLYAWTSPDGKRLNLVMDVVGHTFSDKLDYVFHVDSGKHFGHTTASTTILCRFHSGTDVTCTAGAETAKGDPSDPKGLVSEHARFRVFAGPRDDPFFNNVKGTRAAYDKALAALNAGTRTDAAGCPAFDAATVRTIADEWRHTQGGAPKNLLAGWTTSAIVVSVDLDLVSHGGPLLGVWSATQGPKRQIDRAGRPLTGNALLGTLAPEEISDAFKETYNMATPADGAKFVDEIATNLGLYDGFDGRCGNQWLADAKAPANRRYHALAALLADDRLWVNSASATCTQFFAVERAALGGKRELAQDCGGRTPSYSAANVYRSMLVDGTTDSVSDGLVRDEREPSDSVFPFLAAPETSPAAAGAYQ
ncbi:DUF4331 family protein [Dyella sp. BiH032]|uniref:DUF4331 family protein n=1 Tax=Dyella sp. BiH032 TaxID=3075430 RepID=UPI0028935E0E|nr:DUF4331 family protein [Dyella sp. BiH032]WNL44913.1 DUF4331 family protein [Dyella sp. BiH032]